MSPLLLDVCTRDMIREVAGNEVITLDVKCIEEETGT